MTGSERAEYDAAIKAAQPVLEGLRISRDDAAVESFARGEFAKIGGPVGNGTKHGERLSFKGMASGIATRMFTGELGAKALAPSGATVVPQAFIGDPVALGKPATGLLSVLPVRVQSSADYAFISQSTRTNNAAEVATGTTKPTSVLGLTRVEQTLAVVAHLSEGVPRYWFLDNGSLETFVNSELEFGLRAAVEAKVIADVNDTSGIQSQSYETSAVITLRKALTRIETVGLTAGAIVLHPADFELVELGVASANAIERQGLPYDPAARRLFGVPIATTVSATVGTGHVIAADAVVLDTDSQGVGVQWSETSNSDDFAKNLIRARCEGRFGTSVLSPLGVVVATLAD
jgi:HK97 family phage major capsid protein